MQFFLLYHRYTTIHSARKMAVTENAVDSALCAIAEETVHREDNLFQYENDIRHEGSDEYDNGACSVLSSFYERKGDTELV